MTTDKKPALSALDEWFNQSTQRRHALRLFGFSAVTMSPLAFVACGGGGDEDAVTEGKDRRRLEGPGDPTTFSMGSNTSASGAPNDVQQSIYDIRLTRTQSSTSTENWSVIAAGESVHLMKPNIEQGISGHRPQGTSTTGVSDIRLKVYQTSTHAVPVAFTVYAVAQAHVADQETYTHANAAAGAAGVWTTAGVTRGAVLGTITMGGAAGFKVSSNLSQMYSNNDAKNNGIVIVNDGGAEWVAISSADTTATDGNRASLTVTYTYGSVSTQTFTLGINTGNTVQNAGYDARLTLNAASSSTDNWSSIANSNSVYLTQPDIVGAIAINLPAGTSVTAVTDLKLTLFQSSAHTVPVPCTVYAVAQAHVQGQESYTHANAAAGAAGVWTIAGVPKGAVLGTIVLGGAAGYKVSSDLSAYYANADARANGIVIASDGGGEWVAISTSETSTTDGNRPVFSVTYAYASAPPSNQVKAWSDPSTWNMNGAIPGVGANVGATVTIPVGMSVRMDLDVELGDLNVQGRLVLDPSGTLRTVKYHTIRVTGTVEGGTVAAPYLGKTLFRCIGAVPLGVVRGLSFDGPNGNTPTANNGKSNDQNGVHRAVLIDSGGVLSIHTPRKAHAVKLNGDVAAGATSLVLSADPVGWAVGDHLAIDTTSYFGTSATEFLRISSIVSRTIGFTKVDADGNAVAGGLGATRWGRLQYLTANGASTTAAPVTAASLTGKVVAGTEANSAAYVATATGVPTTGNFTIDERATVLNLSRNVRFDCASTDAAWTSNRDGGHLMWMSGASVQLDGVEFHRMGQRGLLGRYPVHAHMMSWNEVSGAFIPHATSKANLCVVEHCSVWNSSNRAYVCHGTVGSRWSNNVAASGLGHLLFLEDGSEIENTFTGNVLMGARDPGAGLRIKSHDAKASGMWIANLYNAVTNNVASDCIKGIWNAPAELLLGASQNVNFDMGGGVGAGRKPHHMGPAQSVAVSPFIWKDNEAHGCLEEHVQTGNGPTNQRGDESFNQFVPTTDGAGSNLKCNTHPTGEGVAEDGIDLREFEFA